MSVFSTKLNQFLNSWKDFKLYCEDRAKKADCYINNKGWQKLEEYHLRQFLKNIENPYGFLFTIKYRYGKIYQDVKCMNKLYYKYMKTKEEDFTKQVIFFPSWKNRERYENKSK